MPIFSRVHKVQSHPGNSDILGKYDETFGFLSMNVSAVKYREWHRWRWVIRSLRSVLTAPPTQTYPCCSCMALKTNKIIWLFSSFPVPRLSWQTAVDCLSFRSMSLSCVFSSAFVSLGTKAAWQPNVWSSLRPIYFKKLFSTGGISTIPFKGRLCWLICSALFPPPYMVTLQWLECIKGLLQFQDMSIITLLHCNNPTQKKN